MKFLLITCLLITGLLRVKSEKVDEKPEITKLEVIDLGEGASHAEEENSDAQRKRDSGYSYKRPESSGLGSRGRLEFRQSGNKGRIVNRHPAQTSRTVIKYGPPGYSSPIRAGSHNQQHRDTVQYHGHFNQQQSNNFDGRPGGLRVQQVPSPIRQADFAESNPISTQNNRPFATNSANYLPPQNQRLPGHAATQTFSAVQAAEDHHQAQSIGEPQGQLSDAALFLSENAHAIQQLYGAPPDDRDFAPHPDQFLGHANQLRDPNGQFDNFQAAFRGTETFSGPLPSYASGTFSGQETLEQIQSIEKDRLIVQLQRALATQAQAESADGTGRYADNQPSFVQNQDLLASLGQRTKIHGFPPQSSANFGPADTAFNQSPLLPGTTIGPGFPLSYGLSTTTRPTTTATATTATTTSTTTTVQPPQAGKGDGSFLAGSSASPASSVPTGVPVYGGFVPTLIAGTSFVSAVPSYGTSLFAPATVTPVQSSGSSPTHFGLPIPSRPDEKAPTPGATPSTPTSSATPAAPPSPPVNGLSIPVYPVATPLHPVLTSLHPVTPLKPVLSAPPSHVHPVQTPTYGVQTPAISSVLYKPIKPVYPFYYYPNVAYQLSHKPTLPTLPTYPWNYAPTYAQVKPTQIWK